nr:MAG TPA: hypothetical protein [Caudoviricetes sp.]
MIMNYLKLAWAYRKICLYVAIAAAFLYLTYQLKAQKADYLQQTALLKETISDMREANAEAFRQQQEYIATVYKQTSALNKSIIQNLQEKNSEIEDWNNDAKTLIDDPDAIASVIASKLRQELKGDIYNSTAKALNDSRTSIRDTSRLLTEKFSREVSANLFQLITDAEKSRVALKQCIAWADGVKAIVEKEQKSPMPMPVKKGKK